MTTGNRKPETGNRKPKTMIKYKKDTDNIVTLILDMGNRHINMVNHTMYQFFKPVITHLQKEKVNGTLKGIILTSAKKNFLEGGELEYLHLSLIHI